MKKLFTLIAALVMFAGVAMADNITVSFKAGDVSTEYIDTTMDGTHYTGYFVYIPSTDGYYQLRFFINGINDMVDGTTYTLDDMGEDFSWGIDYDLYDYIIYSDASLTRTAGVYTGSVTSEAGNTYTLSQIQPITSGFKDTVIINTTDRVVGRFTDLSQSSDYELIQLVGGDADYLMYFAINTTTPTGTFTESDINSTYTGMYKLADESSISLNNLLGDVTVTENNYCYFATVNWVGTDSILYIINYEYLDPVATTQQTVSGVMETEENESYDTYVYYGYYVYDFMIEGTDYTVAGTIYNSESDDAYGAWDLSSGDIEIGFVDNTTEVEYDGFSGTLTIGSDGTTGTILAYGDIEFTVTGTGTAVENAEVSEYNAYTEGKTIVLNGAEGQNAAIYDVAGRQISNGMVTSDNARFEVAASGVYMVRVNGQTLRVVVK